MSLWAVMAFGAYLHYRGRHWYWGLLCTLRVMQSRGVVVSSRRHTAQVCQGKVMLMKGHLQAPPPCLIQLCVMAGLYQGKVWQRCYMIHPTPYISLTVILWKLLWQVQPICPEQLEDGIIPYGREVEMGQGGQCWEAWGHFIFLLSFIHWPFPCKIPSRSCLIQITEKEDFNAGKDLEENKSNADASNEVNVASDFIACLSEEIRIINLCRASELPESPCVGQVGRMMQWWVLGWTEAEATGTC